MNRRQYIGAIGSAGLLTTVGAGILGESRTLSEPVVHSDAPERQSLEWRVDGEGVGELGVMGTVSSDVIDISTEISHRQNTAVTAIRLRVWMPSAETDTPADVAVVSPVEGDSASPPAVSLSSPRRSPGTLIELTELSDLKDETISTLDLLVRPQSKTATTLNIDAAIELTTSALLREDYLLTGQLELEFPDLNRE